MALTPTEEAQIRQLIAENPALLSLAAVESTIISKLGATKVNLSDLTAATSLSDADIALVRQGLNDKSFAMSVLLDYITTNFPAASTTTQGKVELATNAETQAGTGTTRAVTPAGLASVTATETRPGLVEIASDAEESAWASKTVSSTPGGINFAFSDNNSLTLNGYQRFPGGLIHQWLEGTTSGSGTVSVVFPDTFPNGVWSLQALANSSTPFGYILSYDGSSLTTSGVTVNSVDHANAPVSVQFKLLVVGY